MDSSTSRLLRGFLEPCLLALLESGADYGLSLTRRLEAAGLENVPGGSLYPALTRLERRSLLATTTRPSDSGPARKYYELTDAGRNELATRRAEWCAFRGAVSAILEGETSSRRQAVPAHAAPEARS